MADAKFPILRAPEKLGITPNIAARANIDVDTGGHLVAEAVAGLGGAIANLGLRWDLMQASTQLNEAKMKAKQEHIRLMLALPGIEPGEHAKEYEKSIKVQQSFMPTNRRAAGAYKQLLNDFIPQWELNVENATKAKLKDSFRAAGFSMQQEVIQSGDFVDYLAHLIAGRKNGTYTAEEVAKYRQATIDSRERFVKLQTVQQLEQLEIQREDDRDEISKKIRAGEPADSAIEGSSLDEKEQFTWFERQRVDIERRLRGAEIVTDLARKAELLDMAAAINWPERQVTSQEVKKLALDGRYGTAANLDDAAYDEIRDAVRKAEEDKIPFTQREIEKTIGELITGAPSSVLGLPLPTLRTREDAVRHATNAFGRFIDRIPGVMDTINAKYPPEKRKSTPAEPKGNPAYDFDGELIGGYNPDGSITLNSEGTRRLYEIAGRDAKKTRQLAEQNRYIIPLLKE